MAALLRPSPYMNVVSPKHVLVVGTDQPALGLYESWLSTAGYDVAVCAKFEDAKAYLSGHSIDVLLTDVRLGAFNGLQLALLFKSEHPSGSAIVLTDYADPVLEAEAVRCGAHFIRRPETSADLRAWVEGRAAGAGV